MKVVALKCPNCAGEIQLDSTREFGFCMYCGSKVLIQKETDHRSNNDKQKIDAWITLGLEAIKFGKVDDADRYANNIIENDIDNPHGWYIKGYASKGDVKYSVECWKKALAHPSIDPNLKNILKNALADPYKYLIRVKKKVIFQRENQVYAINPDVKVFIDGKLITTLPTGSTRELELENGRYNLLMKCAFNKFEGLLTLDRDVRINMRWNRITGEMDVSMS